ncbi:MAG: cation transporter, partial [Methanoculleus sp.]
VGIAMGAAGTDIAIEAGDVVLMSDDLGKLAYVRELSHRTVTVIRQNIAVSLINVAFMVAAALLGYLGLVTGLLLNEGSAVFVILNALRLLTWRSGAEPEIPAAARIRAPAIPTAAQTTAAVGCCSCTAPAGGALPVPSIGGGSGCSCGEPQISVAAGATGACCSGAEDVGAASTATASPGAGCSCGDTSLDWDLPTSILVETEGCCCCGEPADEVLPPAPIPGNGSGSSGPATATFRLEGLGCACEGQMVERRVKALKGVTAFTLNGITNQLKVTYDPAAVSVDDIVMAVKKAGVTAVPGDRR